MPWHASTGIIFLVKEDLNQKLGQLFFVGFQGYTLSKKTKQFLQTTQPGGIVFFENNIKSKKQVKQSIREINSCLKIKPFIAVDQEGGSVERLRSICTSLPSAWGLSKVGLKELLMAQNIISSELLELGFNMNFAPVLDINSNTGNPIIGTRSISNKPEIVAKYGSSIVSLFLKNKIIPVVKHFPGHGALNIDSHLALPALNKSKNELNGFELLPFKEAIKNKAPVVMVGHIQLPQIEKDKKKPASLSNKIISGLLRNELGFKGLIITDELNMKGITENYSLLNASYEAILAGADLLLFNFEERSTLKTFTYIKECVSKDKKLLKRINESYKRIILVKDKFLRNKSRSALKHLSAHKLASRVVHWLKKDLFYKPINKNERLEIIYPITPKLKSDDLKTIARKLGIKKYKLHEYNLNPSENDIERILERLNGKKRKILITYDIAARIGQKKLANLLLNKEPDLIVISVGLEYDYELVGEVKSFIAAYAPNFISLFSAFKLLLI